MKRKSHLLRLLKLACLVACVCPQARGEEQDIGKLLDQAIEREVAKLPPNSLKLPEPASELHPPPWIESAGTEFVRAWRTWAQIMAPRSFSKAQENPPDSKDLINAYSNPKPFLDLLKRSIEANPPPDPAEYPRFTYETNSGGFVCGDVGDEFRQLYRSGLTLCLLRRGSYFEILQMDGFLKNPARNPLLKMFGVNPEEFMVGGWFNRQFDSRFLCYNGGEITARILMDWADCRWDEELVRYRRELTNHVILSSDAPPFPGSDLIYLLRPDGGVVDQTKARIVKFIETRGLEILSMEGCIASCPQGAEKWLVPLAMKGLNDELNRVRRKSSRLLKLAGVVHAEPTMRPAPRFSVRVNGKPWPGEITRWRRQMRELELNVDKEQAFGDVTLVPLGDDLYSADPDEFRDAGRLKSVFFSCFPISTTGRPVDPGSLWLRADVQLPINFENVNHVEIESVELAISPKFPERIGIPEEEIYVVQLTRVHRENPDATPKRCSEKIVVQGRKPLHLPYVSPGDYWFRIGRPGPVENAWKKITVSKSQCRIEPVLESSPNFADPIELPKHGF